MRLALATPKSADSLKLAGPPARGRHADGGVRDDGGPGGAGVHGATRCACGGDCPRCAGAAARPATALPPELAVAGPADASEVQARRLAQRVVRAPAPGAGDTGRPRPPTPLASTTPRMLQRAPDASGVPHVTPAQESAIGALRGRGSPLPAATRDVFEARLGRRFGDVRVHTDARAGALASSLDATAFTVGRDIAFAPGTFTPDSSAGGRLLAHELVHVMQNDAAGGAGVNVVHRDTPEAAPATDPEDDALAAATAKADAATAEKAKEEQAAEALIKRWGKDRPIYDLFRDLFLDLRDPTRLTPSERYAMRLQGYEPASLFALGFAGALPYTGLGGLQYRPGTSGFDTFSKTYEAVAALTPSRSPWTDPLSAITGVNLDAYLASETFKRRLVENKASLILLLALAQDVVSPTAALSEPTPDVGGLVDHPIAAHLALVKRILGLALTKFLAAPGTFNVGGILAPNHPSYAHDTYFGGNLPTGLAADAKTGAGGVGEYQHFGATVNLASAMPGKQFSFWGDYRNLNPTPEIAAYGGTRDRRFRGGLLFGNRGFVSLLEGGGHFSGPEAEQLTSAFFTMGAAYAPADSDVVKRLGLKVTHIEWSASPPGYPSATPTEGTATRASPFLTVDIPIGTGTSVGVDASAGITTVSAAVPSITDFTGKLSVTHIGSGTKAMPAFRIELGLSRNSLDFFKQQSPELWGALAKLQAGSVFAGAQVNLGADKIPPARAAGMLDPSTESPGNVAPGGKAVLFVLGFTP